MAFKLKHTGKAFPFKTHKMYKGNKTVTANTKKEHLDYAADGYVHTPPKKLKDRDGSGDVTKKDLLIELGKLNEDGSKTSAYAKKDACYYKAVKVYGKKNTAYRSGYMVKCRKGKLKN